MNHYEDRANEVVAMNAKHSSKSVEHFTPPHVVDAARKALGGMIDLDPASCAEANRTVCAKRFIALPSDGITQAWGGRVFLNPPGGLSREPGRSLYGARSSAVAWWRKLIEEHYVTGRVTAAVFVGFTTEILQTSQVGDGPSILTAACAICVPARRIAFVSGGAVGEQPTHANVIAYLGADAVRFCEAFASLGDTLDLASHAV